ncbi:MAG: enoyl-CoA hydratase/isomerase family protein [Deltaproteobacteria bacterium]|nr:enoyl-CoA hydratase/isomerase family protein [Deltaproteobacteria bacterium]MBI3391235.1 enoyl-CoA hydratase/isomerase family protein [Deltaproteobacteria bacterium]
MRAQTLRTTLRNGIATFTLTHTTINQATAQALCTAVESIELDETIRVVLIAGSGQHFCQGVANAGDWERRVDWIAAIGHLTVPVIAAIDGDAIAEGFELALACDLRLVSTRARFQMPQLQRGELPSHGGTQRLPRIVGRTRALDLLLSGRALTAAEAEAMGLATRVFPAKSFATDVRRVVGDLAAKGPVALRYAKEAVRDGVDLPLDHGIRLEQDLYVLLQTTADRTEGIRAFLEKRRPTFKGS